MQAEQTGEANPRLTAGSNVSRPVAANGRSPVSELDDLRARCERQALAIDKLYTAVLALHRGAAALKAENAELRAVSADAARPTALGGLASTATPTGIATPR